VVDHHLFESWITLHKMQKRSSKQSDLQRESKLRWASVLNWLPLGPNERLILALIYLQALMFLSRTSSKPEKCLCPFDMRCVTSLSKLLKPYGVSNMFGNTNNNLKIFK
jgi:hypothetical protein